MKKMGIFGIAMIMMLGIFTSCSCNATKTEESVEVAIDSTALFPALDSTQMNGPEELAAPSEQPEDAADIPQN